MTQHTLARNFFALFGAQAVAQIAGLFTTALLARALQPEAFGIVGFGAALLSYFGLFVVFGTDKLVMREIARDPESASHRLSRLVGLRIVLLGLAAAAYLLVIELIDQPALVKNVMRVQVLGLVASAISLDFVYQGLQRMRIIGLRQAISSALVLVLTAALVDTPGDILFAAAIPHAVLIVTGAWLAWRARADVGGFAIAVDLPAWGALMRRAAPMAITAVMATVYLNIDIVMLGFLDSQRAVGLYAGAGRLYAIVCVVGGLLVAAFLPTLATLYGRSEAMRAQYRTFALTMLFVGLPAAAIVAGFAPAAIRLLLGVAFADAATVLVILMAAAALNYANQVGTATLLSWNRERAQMYVQVAGAVLNVGLNVVLIPVYGLIGAAVATVASEAAVCIALNVRTGALFGVTVWRPLIALGCAAIAALGAVRGIDWLSGGLLSFDSALLELAVNAGLVGALYVLIAWRAGIVDPRQVWESVFARPDIGPGNYDTGS